MSREWLLGLFGLVTTLALIYLLTGALGNYLDALDGKASLMVWLAAMVFIVGTQILAPLSGYAGFLILVRVFGLELALCSLYGTYLITGAVNFLIARRFGRPAVARLVGPSDLGKIDRWLDAAGGISLVASRIFGYFYFDILSYLWGLTQIDFRKYYLLSMAFTPLPMVAQYVIFRDFDFNDRQSLLLFYFSMVGVAVGFAAVWTWWLKRGVTK